MVRRQRGYACCRLMSFRPYLFHKRCNLHSRFVQTYTDATQPEQHQDRCGTAYIRAIGTRLGSMSDAVWIQVLNGTWKIDTAPTVPTSDAAILPIDRVSLRPVFSPMYNTCKELRVN
jgi:hypothetical protein